MDIETHNPRSWLLQCPTPTVAAALIACADHYDAETVRLGEGAP